MRLHKILIDLMNKRESDLRECQTCKKHGEPVCPNSSKCYALDDHPHYEHRDRRR